MASDPDKFLVHLPPQTTMGELQVDTFNGGGWDPDNDEDDVERSQNNSGGALLLGGFAAVFLGIAVGPVTAVAMGAGSVITAFAHHYCRG